MNKLIHKTIAVLICTFLVATPSLSKANEGAPLEGRVSAISKNDRAPYSGILLDSIAASKMMVDKKYLKMEIELDVRKEFQKELAEMRLASDLLRIELESQKKLFLETNKLKDEQIVNLNNSLAEEMSSDYSEWWILGGIAIGIVLSISVFYASVEVAK
jgi:hypothetical protein